MKWQINTRIQSIGHLYEKLQQKCNKICEKCWHRPPSGSQFQCICCTRYSLAESCCVFDWCVVRYKYRKASYFLRFFFQCVFGTNMGPGNVSYFVWRGRERQKKTTKLNKTKKWRKKNVKNKNTEKKNYIFSNRIHFVYKTQSTFFFNFAFWFYLFLGAAFLYFFIFILPFVINIYMRVIVLCTFFAQTQEK